MYGIAREGDSVSGGRVIYGSSMKRVFVGGGKIALEGDFSDKPGASKKYFTFQPGRKFSANTFSGGKRILVLGSRDEGGNEVSSASKVSFISVVI